MTPRLLVTGSREWDDLALMNRTLASWWLDNNKPCAAVLVHGAARGADAMAEGIWLTQGLPVEAHPAQWDKYGRAAGHYRNEDMVALGADQCIAFFKEGAANRGTADCARKARAAGIPVKEVWG